MKLYKAGAVFLVILFTSTLVFTSKKAMSQSSLIQYMKVERKNWDDFQAYYALSPEIIKGASVHFELVGEDGSVLQMFKTAQIKISDKYLGSKEKFSIKIVVEHKKNIYSESENFTASEKSVEIKNKVNLPIESNSSIATLNLDCKLMRTKYMEEDKWEEVGDFSDVGVTMFLTNKRTLDYVEIPVPKKSSQFNLNEFPSYAELKSQIDADLKERGKSMIKYYFQFVWNRNSYVVEGGTKLLEVLPEKGVTTGILSPYESVQRLVSNEEDGVDAIISASRAKFSTEP